VIGLAAARLLDQIDADEIVFALALTPATAPQTANAMHWARVQYGRVR